MMKYKFTSGECVGVCYDSKWGRAKKGIIKEFDKKNKKGIVKFIPFDRLISEKDEIEVEFTWHKLSGSWGLYVTGEAEVGIMRSLGCKDGDWYSVITMEEFKKADYVPRFEEN